MGRQGGTTRHGPYVLGLVYILLAVGIATAGYRYYKNYRQRYRAEVERRLSAIADLKVGELTRWRKDRLGDAQALVRNPALSGLGQLDELPPLPAVSAAGPALLLGRPSHGHAVDEIVQPLGGREYPPADPGVLEPDHRVDHRHFDAPPGPPP